MVLIFNEIGGYLDVTADGHIGGEKFICDEVFIAQIKTTRKEKHYTIIGLIN